jgi:protein SCO1/2
VIFRKQLLPFFSSIMALLAVDACSNQASKLPKYDHVPAFSMTDADGNPFRSSELLGSVWVADFIYTNCPAECPLMSYKMRSLEKQLPAAADLKLVSISVDPERDTPPVLKEFASHYGAPNKDWIFLTGTPETVHQIAFTTFHVGDIIGKMQHSTKFVLVDKQGFIRGYYSSFDQQSMSDLLRDLKALSKDRS